MNCPKCTAPMRSYERNGVTIDQRSECRGIFLDRDELEHLIDGEARHYATPESNRHDRHDHDDHPQRGHKKHKRGGFLADMLDFG